MNSILLSLGVFGVKVIVYANDLAIASTLKDILGLGNTFWE